MTLPRFRQLGAGLTTGLAVAVCGAATDLDALWDFDRPAVSEQRLRAALSGADGDDALVLRTQVARALGLQRRFDAAHHELDALQPMLAAAGPEARVRALLERGRTWRSSGQPKTAEPLFLQAHAQADAAHLEALAADALHMVALVQPDTDGQLKWNRRALDYARAARDARARGWEAPVLNNLGVTLNDAGRHEEALAAFREALAAYAKRGGVRNVRIARWMVAHTLRRLGRLDEALAQQQALRAEWEAAGSSDPYVFDELALIHAARGEHELAARYKALVPKKTD